MALRTARPVLAWLCLVCLACATLAGRARADEPGESAAQAHRRGVQAFAEERYREAIESFRRADELRPSAAISFNVARAYERLGDPAAAILEYREYLRRAPRARDARKVERRVRALEQEVERQRLEQQQRELEQQRTDDQRLAKWLEQPTVEPEPAPPEPTSQAFTVTSRPAGANVSIDGAPVGTTPFAGRLATGPHTVLLELSGFDDSVQRFELTPDAAKQLTVELRAQPEPVAREEPRTPAPAAVIPAAAALLAGPRVETEADTVYDEGPAGEGGGIGTAGVLGWIAAGSGAAALGGALTLELLRREEEERARRAVTQIDFQDRLETMREQQTAARVLAGVGGGLAVLGSVLLITDAASDREDHEPSQLAAQLMVGPRGAGARLWARY